MRVVLTSFRDGHNWDGDKYSVARWQPRRYSYPSLSWLAPAPTSRFRYIEPALFKERYETEILCEKIEVFRSYVEVGRDLVLMCWCSPERQPGFQHLMCHTVLIGWWIEENFPDVDVVYADGRDRDWFGDLRR